tara:strand:- start:831 stop:2540 length:1710 start_codon:yes stop_codon:yes gene_type:complete
MPDHFQYFIKGEPVQDTPLFIIGCGASTDRFDFRRLANKSSLCTRIDVDNWDLADWRPTYLACLDNDLIETSLPEILRLVNERRIEGFFLSGRALQLSPELAECSSVHFLDELIAHRFDTRGKSHELDFKKSFCFQTTYPDCVTAESCAIRIGAAMGHREIVLVGISDNVAAFEAIRDDFYCGQLPVRIITADPDSRLGRDAVFPYEPLERLLNEAMIGAVIIPLTSGERDQLLDNLWLWSQPAFSPFLGPPLYRRPDLVIVCNNAAAAACESEVRQLISSTPGLQRCFDEVRFETLDLSGDADLYQRENRGRLRSQGWRAGPNNMFFAAMDAVRDHWGHSLYMETDCVPIRPDWLGQVNTHLRGAEPAWVTGSIYRGADALGPREKRHINGNAVYATADPDFQHFVDSVWRPKLAEIITERPELPFDCLVEALYELADARLGDADANWKTLRSISHKFRYSALIPNFTSERGTLHELADQIEGLLRGSPESCIIHTRALAGFIGALRTSGLRPSMTELLTIVRDIADDLPPRPPVSSDSGKDGVGWSTGRIRQRLTRLLPAKIKRLID